MAKRKPKVVVVGALGFAGRRVHALLSASCEVVLVDAKGFFEFTPAVLRCLVEPQAIRRILVPAGKDVLRTSVHSAVMAPDGKGGSIVCEDKQHIDFDFLVLCTGSSYQAPIKAAAPPFSHPSQSTMPAPQTLEDRAAELASAASKLANATKVVVVGGGTVGVELAAEIAGHYGRQKSVVLINSKQRLLERMPASAGSHAEAWLVARGVQVLHSTTVSTWPAGDEGPQTLLTSGGERVSADIIYNCTGCRPQGQQLCASLLTSQAALVASTGPAGPAGASNGPASKHWPGIPVNAHLQVLGCCTVFCCGDAACCQGVEKTAYAADLGAAIVAANVQRMLSGQRLLRFPQDIPRVREVAQVPVVAVVSLYKYDGILQFNRLVLTGLAAAANKWFIELIQLRIAAGSGLWLWLWLWIEALMTCVGSFVFLS